MSRTVRVVVILALFGWAVAGVPDWVQAQRDAVAELAAERGAASAGGALLARIGDLRVVGEGEAPGVWRVAAETTCAPAVAVQPTYADAVEAVRGQRACEAARRVAHGRGASVVEVDGDPFLVVPSAIGAVEEIEEIEEIEAIEAIEAIEDVTVGVASGRVTVVVGGESVDVAVPVPLDANKRLVIETLGALGILGPEQTAYLLRADPETPVPTAAASAATVAWWPPLQAEIEARTGIPLQVGGAPPLARAILPAHRLTGVPVWSLPTPETEAAIDLLDGGTIIWMLLLGALLAREGWAWRRDAGIEQDRQTTRDAILQRISHELRTPAASVRSLVDALALPDVSEAERAQFRELARSEAERLATGIDRLLQAARGETRVSIDPVPLDLAAWADAVRARWATRLPTLVVEATRPSPAVADPERLDEAVDALLDNATKYGGPNVTLTVAPGRIAVEDDGEGIPPKDRARLVQKFERREGRVNDPGGHGLGLWAVTEVARAHRGRLVVEGRSRFVLVLGAP